MWHMHDGAPAHFSRAVRDVYNYTNYYRWIGRGGPIAWTPCSPDLNPPDFKLWGHLKTLVYAAPVENKRIVNTCQTIRNVPGIFERMRRSMMRRVEVWIESHGGQFEYLL
jgi:hypothetical protein